MIRLYLRKQGDFLHIFVKSVVSWSDIPHTCVKDYTSVLCSERRKSLVEWDMAELNGICELG